jgi:hypothetical protein
MSLITFHCRNHTGLDLSVRDIYRSVQDFYGVDGTVAAIFTGGGLLCCGHVFAGTLDLHGLALHNRLEHDGSLTHAPTITGSRFAPTFRDPLLVERAISFSTDGATLSLDDLARARVAAEDAAAAPLNSLHARLGRGEVALVSSASACAARGRTLMTYVSDPALPWRRRARARRPRPRVVGGRPSARELDPAAARLHHPQAAERSR